MSDSLNILVNYPENYVKQFISWEKNEYQLYSLNIVIVCAVMVDFSSGRSVFNINGKHVHVCLLFT